MLVRITRQPRGDEDGMALHHYHVGQTYEIDSSLASYLVLNGFAELEMRRQQRSFRARPTDRRTQPYSYC